MMMLSSPDQTTATASVDSSSSSSLLRQTLMTQDECFVYKVPPLVTASGYRANDWNLAQPLQTCGFQVERRDNDLYLLFTLEDHTKLFAMSQIQDGENLHRSIEPVLDSSRYFVTKIISRQGDDDNKKTALLGFGFRDRDVALDLLGNLQQFQKSIQREIQAKQKLKVTEIPTLKQGDKMHITLPGGKMSLGRKKHSSTTTTNSGGGGGSGPILLKKPPPSADATYGVSSIVPTALSPQSEERQQRKVFVQVNLSEMEAPMDVDEDERNHAANKSDDDTREDASEAAVARSIIHDFDDDLEDDSDLEDEVVVAAATAAAAFVTAMETSESNVDDDDVDFGDFQGA